MKLAMKFVVVTSLLVFCALGFAQIPDTQYSQGISYISGGVGEEESTAILAEAKQWPLLLELSQLEGGRGVWIFGAKIKILNAKNQVIFDAQADGPYILINLAAGTYSIDAVYQEVSQKRVISINPATPQKISIFWK